MMRFLFISIVILFFVFGCKTNQMKDKKREGRWVELYTQDSFKYKSVGKYHEGDPIKKWRYYLNGKIIKKEKRKKNFCYTINYFENGKIESFGKTKIDLSSKNAHWFYTGEWNYFNEKGNQIAIRIYENGKLISEKKFQ